MYKFLKVKLIIFSILLFSVQCNAQQSSQWNVYNPKNGSEKGKHIVLISGDEEYRSEEALPMMAKILSQHHGFKCTVLFAINPKTGEIDPDDQTNIPGLEQLKNADLVVLVTRFRELPDDQMKNFDDYLNSGKPIITLRTSTHPFSYSRNKNSPYAKYSYDSKIKGWEGGFGRRVLGETWVEHHGDHGKEGTRGLINGVFENHPILNGVQDIWGPTDVYTIRDLPENAEVLVYGQVTEGMTPESMVNFKKSIMPVAWIRHYKGEKGLSTPIFATTMGASVDLVNEDLRRLLVNACYWAVGFEKQIPERGDVSIIGKYEPTMFGFGSFQKGLKPSDYR
jgi:type 1 glutamine amidotransferase